MWECDASWAVDKLALAVEPPTFPLTLVDTFPAGATGVVLAPPVEAKAFPGDFKNFTESKEPKDSRKTAKDKYEKDKQHPVKGKHAAFDRLVNSGKEEQKAFKKYRKNL